MATTRNIAFGAVYSTENSGPVLSVAAFTADTVFMFPGRRAGWTVEGGLAVKLVNKSGAPSVKGTIVECSSTVDQAFNVASADAIDPIGVCYESGVADGLDCWVVTGGVVDVLLADSTASTRKNWVRLSVGSAGRADATSGTPGSVAVHFQEIGHALESKIAGTNVLCRIALHFN